MQDQDETKESSDETKTSQKKNREVLSLKIPEGVAMKKQVEQIHTRQRDLSSSPSDSLRSISLSSHVGPSDSRGRITLSSHGGQRSSTTLSLSTRVGGSRERCQAIAESAVGTSLSSRSAIPQAADDTIDEDDAQSTSIASSSSSAIPQVATSLLQLAQGKSDRSDEKDEEDIIDETTGHTRVEQKKTEVKYKVATVYPTGHEDAEIMGTAVDTVVVNNVTFAKDEKVTLKHAFFSKAVWKIVKVYNNCFFAFFEWMSKDQYHRPYKAGWNTHFPLGLCFAEESYSSNRIGFGTRLYVPWSDQYLVGAIIPRDTKKRLRSQLREERWYLYTTLVEMLERKP
jgi:hypothetical protein